MNKLTIPTTKYHHVAPGVPITLCYTSAMPPEIGGDGGGGGGSMRRMGARCDNLLLLAAALAHAWYEGLWSVKWSPLMLCSICLKACLGYITQE